MFAIAAISSRQTILNKYLQNNKGVNWNGLAVDDFAVACVAGSVVEACTDHQIGTSVHAPQRPMVTCIMMGTVVPGPHGLLCL
ncbi:hypothetical protein TNCV_4790951 [Trichonephila clavipes]|nr:hypothetical protein TNCV_4790951 [Trichonephila clavipes]